jgi:multiple sugar transport system permease protein
MKNKLLLTTILLTQLVTAAQTKTKIICWGMWDTDGDRAVIQKFEELNPDIEVKIVRISAGGMDPQKLMTAIAGGKPPDVIQQDRFSVGEWASRDAFIPLDDFIKRDKLDLNEFYGACLKEAVYKNKVYAIPRYADDRIMFYNKKLFRENGLDPERPPKDWDELMAYSKKLTKYDLKGNFKSIGFIPNFGNSWLYLYGWQNGGKFMSDDGKTCLLNEPKIEQALTWLVKFYDQFKGVEAINTFGSTFQGGQYDPFITGKIGMVIQCSGYLSMFAWYAPDMDFGVAPPPSPKGMPAITWSGGFSVAIPYGAKHTEEAWRFIKYLTSVDGWVVYVQKEVEMTRVRNLAYIPNMTANQKADKLIFERFATKKKNLAAGQKLALDMMPASKFRPVTPVGQKLWDEHVRAFDLAVFHKLSPKEALDRGTWEVQQQLDKIMNKPPDRPVQWRYVIGFSLLLLVIAAILMFMKSQQMNRESKLVGPEIKAGLTFMSPWAFGFLVFTAGPIISSIVLSFTDYDVLHPANFVGLKNYTTLLTKDPLLWKSIYNTVYLAVFSVPLGIIVGIALSMILNVKVKGIALFRTIFFLPSIMPVVASSVLWMWILHPEFGLLNAMLRSLNIIKPDIMPTWLGSEVLSKPSLILMGLWGAGGSTVFWLAGLNSIPNELYEASSIDGASWSQRFLHITLPLLTPYIFFQVVMGVIGALQVFAQAFIMTGGGPVDSTMFYVYNLFNAAFKYFRMGYASAMAWLLFIVILILTVLQLKLSKKWVHYR